MISLDQADNLINAAFQHANERNTKPLAAAVVDEGGQLIAFNRQDGASLLRFNIAMGKAWGAVAMLNDSRAFAEVAEARPAFLQTLVTMTDGKIIPSPGGVLIHDANNQLLGAIGISGDLPDVDEACSIAAISKVLT